MVADWTSVEEGCVVARGCKRFGGTVGKQYRCCSRGTCVYTAVLMDAATEVHGAQE